MTTVLQPTNNAEIERRLTLLEGEVKQNREDINLLKNQQGVMEVKYDNVERMLARIETGLLEVKKEIKDHKESNSVNKGELVFRLFVVVAFGFILASLGL